MDVHTGKGIRAFYVLEEYIFKFQYLTFKKVTYMLILMEYGIN